MEFRKQTLVSFAKKKFGFLPMASVFVGVFLFWEIHHALTLQKSALTEPRFLVARRDLAESSPIAFSDLTLLPRHQVRGNIPSGALTDQELSLLSEASLIKPLLENEILTAAHLATRSPKRMSGSVPPGRRAYALTGLTAPEVRAGDFVDIHFTSETQGALGAILLEDVPVLRSHFEDARMVVAVLPDDIELLEKAKQTGTLSVALRNPSEGKKAHPKHRVLWPRRRGEKVKAEVWSEAE